MSLARNVDGVSIMGALLPLIIQLISGAVGGNIVGGVLKNLTLGPTGNTIAGGVGGLVGGFLLPYIGVTGATAVTDAVNSSGLDIGTIISNVAGGGVGGLILTAIVGAIKNALAKS
jgi:hypothetical protein